MVENLYILVFALAALSMLPLVYLMFRTQIASDLQKSFRWLLVFDFLWATSQIGIILVNDLTVLKLTQFASAILSFLVVATYTIFVIQYTQIDILNKRSVVSAILLPYAVYLAAAILFLFSPTSSLITEPFTYVSIDTRSGLRLFLFVYFVSLNVFLLSLLAYRSTFSKEYTGAPVLLLGLSIPVALGFISFSGFLPADRFPHTVLGHPVFVISAFYAISQSDALDPQPIAIQEFKQKTPDIFLVLDTSDRIVDFNRKAAEVLGPLDTGKSIYELSSLEDEQIGKIQSNDDSQIIECSEGFFLSTSSKMRSKSGKEIGSLIYLRDVTSLEKNRRRLQSQNQKLQHISDSIAHEVKNPLMVIQQYTEIFLEDPEDPNVDLEVIGDKILASTQRIEDAMDNIRWFSELGQDVEEYEEIQLSEIAEHVWDLTETKYQTLKIENDGTIHGDKKKLRALFDNLFRNSIKHSGRENVTITVSVSGDSLSIRDNGKGIPENQKDEIFDFGYTTHSEGQGFGLSLVSAVVDAHGWDIELVDSPGAHFKITNVKTESSEDNSGWKQ